MAEIKRSTLFGKLNSIGYKAIEGATIFCKMRGNPYVETVHWLHQLLQSQDSDVHRIIKHFQLDPSRLAADLIAALDKLPRGATAISDFSPDITNVVERAWVYGSLMFGESQVRTGHLIVGFLNSELRHKFLAISREFTKIKLEELTDNFAKITAGSPEERSSRQRRLRPERRRGSGRNQRCHGARRDGQAGSARKVLRGSHRKSPQR